jgi:purine-binding chemotaxis protein CheW
VSGSRQFCTFMLQGLLLGIEVDAVQEVIRSQPLTPVPLSPPEVAGLINLRGQIVAAIDLRQRLGLAAGKDDTPVANIVIRTPDGPVSLLVEEIGDVAEVDEAAIEPVPDTTNECTRALVYGVYPLQDRLLLLLDGARAVSGWERNDE